MKKLLSLLLALAMFAGLALPAMAEEPVTIEFWYSFENQMVEQIMTVIAAFEEANPGIKVKPTYAGSYNESNQKLLAAHVEVLFIDTAHPRGGSGGGDNHAHFFILIHSKPT